MPDEIRLYGGPGHRGFLLGMFREIRAHSQEVGAPVELVDDPLNLTFGFRVRGGEAGIHWKIPITRLKDRLICFGMGDAAHELVRELIPKAEGRARLATMLTDGTFPGA